MFKASVRAIKPEMDQRRILEHSIGGKSTKGKLIRKGKKGMSHRLKVTESETQPVENSRGIGGGEQSLSILSSIGRPGSKRAREAKGN